MGREKIAKEIQSIRDFLATSPDSPMAARMRTRLAELTRQAETNGGMSVGGDVETGGGDLVGRDKTVQASEGGVAVNGNVINSSIIIQQSAEIIQHGLSSNLSPDVLREAIRKYLVYVYDRYIYLNLKGMADTSGRIPLRLELLDVYVPLQARMGLPENDTLLRPHINIAERHYRQEKIKRKVEDKSREQSAIEDTKPYLAGRELDALGSSQPLLEIVQKHNGVVILGDPGAGKTTFLKYLALKLAQGKGPELGLDGRLPVLLPLSAYANALEKGDIRLDRFIAEYFDKTVGNVPIGQMLDDALDAGRTLILLDGLDEVRDLNLRNTVVERVTDFYAAHQRAGNKFVLTSRIVGYPQVRSTAAGLEECTLVDFNDEEIAAFIERWTLALEKQAQGETQVARQDAETERRELLEAVQRNPGVRRLAANPLMLTILALMKRQDVTLPERRVQLYDQYVSTLIATWNRARSLSGRAPGRHLDDVRTRRLLAPLALWMHRTAPGTGLVHRADLLRQLESILRETDEPSPTDVARQFLEDVRQFTALLLERGANEYGFIHLTFEEYLAAVGLALQAEGEPQPVVEALTPHVGEQAWREVTLLAVAYIGIIQNMPGKAGQVVEALAKSGAGEPGEAVLLAGEALRDAWPDGVRVETRKRILPHLVTTMQNVKAAPKVRRRVGLVLGNLGWLPEDLDAFVFIPKGKFLYGSNQEEREVPYEFWMARYPVTNAQYAHFVRAGGYEEPEWWSEEGWMWRTGKYDERAAKTENEILARRKNRDLPYGWYDSGWNNPIFPVVGITWFEAEAYATWLNAQLKADKSRIGALSEQAENLGAALASGRYCVRLPEENEWEYAARGADGRRYPWGNDFEPAFVNSAESKVDVTTAVCTYPQGASPFKVWDLGGNIWEWTRKAGHIKGGGWSIPMRRQSVAFSLDGSPVSSGYALGFRVVCSIQATEAA